MISIKLLIACVYEPRKTLRLYGLGALLFFIGIGFIQAGDQLVEPSLKQEVTVLMGVLIGGSGFLTAMIAQCILILQRFQQMGKQNKEGD